MKKREKQRRRRQEIAQQLRAEMLNAPRLNLTDVMRKVALEEFVHGTLFFVDMEGNMTILGAVNHTTINMDRPTEYGTHETQVDLRVVPTDVLDVKVPHLRHRDVRRGLPRFGRRF